MAQNDFWVLRVAGSGGTGLGPSVVYGTVRQSGGQIQVESQPGRRSDDSRRHGDDPVRGGRFGHPDPGDSDSGSLGIPRAERVRRSRSTGTGGAHEGEIDKLLTDVIMPSLRGHELAGRLMVAPPGLKVESLARLVRGVLDGES